MALAQSACDANQPPFESYALRGDIAIEMADFEAARQYLDDIRAKFRNAYSDVQSSLWCKYSLAQGKWNEALSFWDKISEKDLPVHKALMIRILEAKGKDFQLSLTDRQAAQSKATVLRP